MLKSINRLWLFALTGCLTLSLILTGCQLYRDYQQQREQQFEQIQSLLHSLLPAASLAAFNLDPITASQLTSGLLQHPAIYQARILQETGQSLAFSQSQMPVVQGLKMSYPLSMPATANKPLTLGRLELTLDPEYFLQNFKLHAYRMIRYEMLYNLLLILGFSYLAWRQFGVSAQRLQHNTPHQTQATGEQTPSKCSIPQPDLATNLQSVSRENPQQPLRLPAQQSSQSEPALVAASSETQPPEDDYQSPAGLVLPALSPSLKPLNQALNQQLKDSLRSAYQLREGLRQQQRQQHKQQLQSLITPQTMLQTGECCQLLTRQLEDSNRLMRCLQLLTGSDEEAQTFNLSEYLRDLSLSLRLLHKPYPQLQLELSLHPTSTLHQYPAALAQLLHLLLQPGWIYHYSEQDSNRLQLQVVHRQQYLELSFSDEHSLLQQDKIHAITALTAPTTVSTNPSEDLLLHLLQRLQAQIIRPQPESNCWLLRMPRQISTEKPDC